MRVDWVKVIERLVEEGFTSNELAWRLDVTERAIRNWRAGESSPTHYRGELLIGVYCTVMDADRDQVPQLFGPPRRQDFSQP